MAIRLHKWLGKDSPESWLHQQADYNWTVQQKQSIAKLLVPVQGQSF